jgi:hypothetical protein
MGSGGNKATRHNKTVKVSIALGAAVSEAIDLREFAAAGVIMDSAWTAADLGVQVCDTQDGTFVGLADRSNAYGTDVSIDGAVASKAYPLPPFAFAFPYIKLWSHNGSGTNTNQDASRSLTVVLKS